jgi:predicted esterase
VSLPLPYNKYIQQSQHQLIEPICILGFSEGYNINLYPNLRKYNTQIAEQVHLEPLVPMV